MHVTGQGFTMWAVLSVSMGWGSVDGGADGLLPNNDDFRTGVTFWARIGDTSSNKVRFAISDKYSRPEGGYLRRRRRDGRRLLRHVRRRSDPARHAWRQYRIPFGGLTQRNFGLPRHRLDTSSIYTSSSSSIRPRPSTSGWTTSRSTSRSRAKRESAGYFPICSPSSPRHRAQRGASVSAKEIEPSLQAAGAMLATLTGDNGARERDRVRRLARLGWTGLGRRRRAAHLLRGARHHPGRERARSPRSRSRASASSRR